MNVQNLKLYQSMRSPNARRVRIFLAEKGLSIPYVEVDLGQREQRSEAYRVVNPRQVVPTLVVGDGTAIGEVPAILRYLEEAFPEVPLHGTTAVDKALINMWERRAEQEGFAAVMDAVRNTAPGLKGRALSGPHDYEQIPALAERSLQRVKDFYSDSDEHLSSSPYMAGRAYSVADITALVTVDFAASALKLAIPDGHVALRSWHDKISARPASKA
jgi:glutathione S-transferase